MSDGLDLIIEGVDLSALDTAILRYVNELGLELPRVVKQTARLLNKDLVKMTPPNNQKQGRQSVSRDINRAVLLLDPDKIHWDVLKTAIRDREYDVVQSWLSRLKSGPFKDMELVHFSPTLHTGVRDRRGRVQRSKKKLTLDRSEHTRYVKSVQGHVGYTRAWWAPSAAVLGASLPGWINRHHVTGQAVINNLDRPNNPEIIMINRGPGVSAISSAAVNSAIRRRTTSMNRDVNQVLAGRASKYFS